MKIALYPISAKPYHLGHHMMIQKASKECDKVIAIVSLLDRENVTGSDMATIWKNHILKILPENVSTIFLQSSPVSRVFEILKLREQSPSSDYKFCIYSDESDITKNYSNSVLEKICPRLLMDGGVEKKGIPRSETVQIRGSDVRRFILHGDFSSFEKSMPKELDSKSVFEMLATLNKHC
jgi:citrate lyase synthetase